MPANMRKWDATQLRFRVRTAVAKLSGSSPSHSKIHNSHKKILFLLLKSGGIHMPETKQNKI